VPKSDAIYVLDTGTFIEVERLYPDRFPSFWRDLDALADAGRLHSVSEVTKELVHKQTREFLAKWVDARDKLFPTPTTGETKFVADIFKVPGFLALVNQKKQLKGGVVADPWVVARAATLKATVVSQETRDTDKIRIPKVCRHFNIPCVDLQGMMKQEGWVY